MRYIERTAHNTYHAATLRLERRFEKGLSFVTAYTYAKTMDTYGNLNDTTNFYSQNTYDKDADKGLASFHAKHRFTTGYIWELPFGRSRRWGSDMHAVLDGVLGGWQLSGITTFQTGNPLRILLPPICAGYFRDWRKPSQAGKTSYFELDVSGYPATAKIE